ncbi:MAG: hypothetical protein J6R35_02570, partial [Clostridia bacterium]|nr:hypothetical protein [Clostridia bacterium]
MLQQFVKGKNSTKLILTLMLLCAIGFVLALGVRPATPIALAEEGVIDNSINVTINDCVNTDIQLGQAGSDGWEDLFATDTQTGVLNSENPVMASAVATQTVTITLGDDSTEGDAMRKAIASGRMSARLKIESVNTFTTTSGSNINNVAEYKLSGALGNYPADDKSATLVQKGATANDGGDSTIVELSKSGYLTSNGLVEGDASFTKLTSIVITIVYKATTTAVAQPSGLTAPVASCNVLCDVAFSLELDFEEVLYDIHLTSGGKVYDGEVEIKPDGDDDEVLGSIEFNKPISAYRAEPDANYYFVGWLETGKTTYIESLTLPLGNAKTSVDIPSGTIIDYTAQFRPIVATEVEAITNGQYVYSGEGQKVGPIIRDALITGQYWVKHKYVCIEGNGIDGQGTTEFEYFNKPDSALYLPETVYAGTYKYIATFYYKDDTAYTTPIGTYSFYRTEGVGAGQVQIEGFVINKNTPSFQVLKNGESITNEQGNDTEIEVSISLGETLDGIFVLDNPQAANSVYAPEKISGKTEFLYKDGISADYMVVPDFYLFDIDYDGTRSFVIRFTPTNQVNYAPAIINIDVKITNNILQEALGAGAGIGSYSGEVEVVEIANNKRTLKVNLAASLDANMFEDGSANYYFAGWRLWLPSKDYTFIASQAFELDESGKPKKTFEYSYYFDYPEVPVLKENATDSDIAAYNQAMEEYKATIADYVQAKFQAVFVEDQTARFDASINAYKLTVMYNGEGQGKSPTLYPAISGVTYGHISYLIDGAAISGLPKEIGTYLLTYDIINTGLNENIIVGKKTIVYEIKQNIVSVEFLRELSQFEGGYNVATGWAKKGYYNLTVNNLVAGGADAYYYSVDGGASWTQIAGSITNAKHCQIEFTTPNVVNNSVVNRYTFKAEKDGKVIAQSAVNEIVSKIDTTVPTIS